jgi:hypothetical protein
MKRLALFILRLAGYREKEHLGVIFLVRKDMFPKEHWFKTLFWCDGEVCSFDNKKTKLYKARKPKQYTPRKIKMEIE